ncbi:MAG: GtrA family protein [Candidatus Synoicihabitans palmerolidicus]|nr:GtrA family protein [Candidatus Synoicihabitans palmerolidicus]
MIFNFLLNRFFVFRAAESKAAHQLSRFVLTSVLFRLGEWCTFNLLSSFLPTHYTVLATLIQFASLLLKYVVFRRFICR